MPIRERLKAAIDHLRRDYLQTAWKWRQRLRVVTFYLRNASGWIKRLSILAASLTMARLVVQSVELSRLEPNVLAAYFIAVGAMIGGILAIVFSISIFAQQSATDLSSSGYFEDYTRGWNEKLIYVLIVTTTLFFFTLGLLFNGRQITDAWKEWAIHASLVLIGVVFVLIDWHYQNVSMKLSPLKAMSYLEGRAVKFLKSVHADAKRIARLLKANNKDAPDNLALATAYNRYLQPHLMHLDRQIENLFEIALRLSARQEVMTTNRALGSVANILYQYLDARKSSSVAWLSSVAFLAFESDSQSFLTKSFERLNNAGQRFIRDGRTENATYVVHIYKALAAKAGEITFQQKHYENPIFDQIIGYLGFYIKFAIQEKDLDVVLSGARGFSALAQVALEHNFQSSLLGIQNNLHEIATFGITAKATFITDECIRGWQSILGGLFHFKFFGAEHQISEALKKMGAVTNLMHTALASDYLPNDFNNRISLGKSYDEMYLLISIILKVYFAQLTQEKDREHYRENLVALLKEIYSNIRHLSEQVPIIESSLATSIGNLLGNLNAMIIRLLDDKSFADESEKLREQLYANIHLPGFLFTQPDSFKAGRFESLTESVAKTGILLLQRRDADDLVFAWCQLPVQHSEEAIRERQRRVRIRRTTDHAQDLLPWPVGPEARKAAHPY